MSDISITFPPWMSAWFLLGEAVPVTTLVLLGLAAALWFGRPRRTYWLRWSLAIVGLLWLGGIGFWAAGLLDEIQTAIYQARHHYRLDKATVMAGIEIPGGSWVSVDQDGVLYGIEPAEDAVVSIDGASWRGEVRLIYPRTPSATDRGTIKSATLAADAAIQGMPCRAGTLVEFSEFGGGLEHCTLTRRTRVTAEIEDNNGGKSTENLACAADQDVFLYRGLLERCVLAETAMGGPIACAGGKAILFAGAGLDSCTLASAQRVRASELPAGTLVRFTRLRLSEFETPPDSASVQLSGVDIPGNTVVSLCEPSGDIEFLSIPKERYVTIQGVKLTGRLNFDCGKFRSAILFEDTVLGDRRLPRHAVVLYDDVFHPSSR